MTQSLSNLMNSPLALAALILWLLLAFLAVRACRKWAKERNAEKTIHKNHPAIPVKKYKLSDTCPGGGPLTAVRFESATTPVRMPAQTVLSQKLSTEQQAQRLASLRNVWDT